MDVSAAVALGNVCGSHVRSPLTIVLDTFTVCVCFMCCNKEPCHSGELDFATITKQPSRSAFIFRHRPPVCTIWSRSHRITNALFIIPKSIPAHKFYQHREHFDAFFAIKIITLWKRVVFILHVLTRARMQSGTFRRTISFLINLLHRHRNRSGFAKVVA